MNAIILLPIIIPMIMGVIMLLAKKMKSSLVLGWYGAVAGILCLASLIVLSLNNNGDSITILTMFSNLSIKFAVDDMALLFAILGTSLWIIVSIYSIIYFHEDNKLRRYDAFYLFALGCIMGLCLSANVITMYLGFEMMTLTTFPFVLQNQTEEAIKGAFKYIFFSICGAMTALAGIFFIYPYCKGLDFVKGGILDMVQVNNHKTLILVAAFLIIVGFAAKAGMFPLHAWLPVAHPVAPAPASALLSGFITKCGVLAISRMVFYVIGADFLRGTWVQYTWMILALITVFMGSMQAYMEKVLKKRLAYSTVSQVSYILFGLSLMNNLGLMGAYMHLVYHGIVKVGLFLFSGIVIHQTKETMVDALDGLGKSMPVTYVCYTLLSITLVGIPPTSAFLSKLYLCQGAVKTGTPWIYYVGIATLLVSALLTAGYLLSITVRGFYYPATVDSCKGKREPGLYMVAPMIILTVCALLLGLYANPLLEAIEAVVNGMV